MKKKFGFFDIINKIEDVCLVIMFALMVLTIFLQIIMRFVFNNSLVWSEELGKFIFVWISWLGISIGERKNEHIKITLITERFPKVVQKILEIIAYLILTAILVVTIFYAIKLLGSQWKVHYAGIKISTSFGYLSLVLGCLFMELRVIGVIVRDVIALIKKDYDMPSHPCQVNQVEEAVETFKNEGGEV